MAGLLDTWASVGDYLCPALHEAIWQYQGAVLAVHYPEPADTMHEWANDGDMTEGKVTAEISVHAW